MFASSSASFFPRYPVTVHRDQDQPLPLEGALSRGCSWVEIDVHESGDQILVGHDRPEEGRTLEEGYLQPLQALVNEGRLQGQVSLLIDIKSEARSTLQTLLRILKNYEPILTRYEGQRLETRYVQIIITGNRDREAIEAQSPRITFLDGRLEDCNDSIDPYLTPMISDNWRNLIRPSHASMRRCGALVARVLNCRRNAEDPRLQDLAEQLEHRFQPAIEAGVKVRAWAVPEREEIWSALLHLRGYSSYVFNTDQPERLCAFLDEHENAGSP